MKRRAEVLPDTNVILRYLLRDNEEQYRKAAEFFEEVREGGRRALLLESVLVECVYVLTKFYNVPKTEAAEVLDAVLRYKGVVNPDREELLEGLVEYRERNLDIVDCLVMVKGRREGRSVFSFDRKLMAASSPET